jgi:selenocysteine lyase/cysteine desulfurase
VRPAPTELPFKFVTGTTNRESLAGVRGAIEYYEWVRKTFGTPAADTRRAHIVAGVEAMEQHNQMLAARLIAGLQAIDGVTVLGITDPAHLNRRVPTVSFCTDITTPGEIAQHMAEHGIYIWSGHNYGVEPCRLMGVLDKGCVVRVGPTHYNKPEEIDRFLALLGEFLQG